jgi:predicted RNA binding protein YcfA (HicA-like mRNA interferase family)
VKSISGKEMCKVLERHGWTCQRINGSHHMYTKPGSRFTIPVPVHANQSLKLGLQHRIMRLAGLTDADL